MSSKSNQKVIQAVLLGAGRPYKGSSHSGLADAGADAIILDWILASLSGIADKIDFVGGYEIDSIKKKYPQLNYSENLKWKTSKSAGSLLSHDLKHSCDYIVSYVDIVYRKNLVSKLLKGNSDITVAVDSTWISRYSGRAVQDILSSEKVSKAGESITKLGKDISVTDASAEFLGLVKFGSNVLDFLRNLPSESIDLLSSQSIVDLIEYLRIKGFSVSSVDVLGDWAELNDPRDISQFILGTKAETLERLQSIVTKSKILDQKAFLVSQWLEHSDRLISDISDFFNGEKVIVRSSALGEDNFETANAGAFESLLNVDVSCPGALKQAVNKVIASYSHKDPNNQVLVQPMLKEIDGSGVIFTRVLQNGAPYYVVNYDDQSNSTESITSGNTSDFKTYKIRRTIIVDIGLPDELQNLLHAVKEIEDLFGHDCLDIEFAISKDNSINILQVRPIVVKHSNNPIMDNSVTDCVNDAKHSFNNLQLSGPQVVGDEAFFGSMPDWNPAEIIGVRPGRLSSDLYDDLIMSDVWARQRAEYGYRDVRPFGLMKFFGGQPYVDIRASFNSLVPKNIDEELAKKYVNFYLSWLKGHAEFHDKIEFDVVPTCYALGFDGWRKRFIESELFSSDDVDVLELELKAITKRAIQGIHTAASDLETLSRRHESLMNCDIEPISKARMLLADAKSFGTPAFAHLARDGFVAVTLLKSGVTSGILSSEALDEFMESIKSVTHHLTDDAKSVRVGDMSWDLLVKKYGHLRPDTYNIESDRYSSRPEFFLKPIVEDFKVTDSSRSHSTWQEKKVVFYDELLSHGLGDCHETIERFLITSIEGREYAKFLFSRNVSDALEQIAAFGTEVGLNRKELSMLPLSFIYECESRKGRSKILQEARSLIEVEKMNANIFNNIELPPLIFSEHDFDFFLLPKEVGNFIGEKSLISQSVFMGVYNGDDLSGKLILIESADPGYDWLFGRNISGLVTKYGGANSHMAIRTAEFGLPAVIGVGEQTFDTLTSANVIEIDCSNRIIRKVR